MDVDFETKTAMCTLKEGTEFPADQAVDGLAEAGFKGSVVGNSGN